MAESRTEEAVLTAYHHYMAIAKDSDNACWGETGEALWTAYQELHQYHKIHKGHGDLVDADKVILGLVYGKHIDNAKCGEIAKIFNNAVVIPADKGMCYNCQYKTDSCQEGLHCIRDSEG